MTPLTAPSLIMPLASAVLGIRDSGKTVTSKGIALPPLLKNGAGDIDRALVR
jgi:hypothetical protein